MITIIILCGLAYIECQDINCHLKEAELYLEKAIPTYMSTFLHSVRLNCKNIGPIETSF